MTDVQTVLCAFDFSGASRSALVQAADLAERERAALHLLHVTPLFRARMAHVGGDPEAGFRAQARDFVGDVLGADDAFDVIAPVVHESTGETPAGGIVRYAREAGADVVVMGTHGRQGLEHVLLGSVAAEALRLSPVPVLVVPESAGRTAPAPEAPVVVAVDFSAHTAPALEAGAHLASLYQAPLAAAHVWDAPAETLVDSEHVSGRPHTGSASREDAHEALDAVLRAAGLDAGAAETFVVPGWPATKLAEVARRSGAGLLVVGTHGRRGWDRFRLGSVAEGVVRQSPCPVLVVPAPEAASASRA